jgi:hypothetical protein
MLPNDRKKKEARKFLKVMLSTINNNCAASKQMIYKKIEPYSEEESKLKHRYLTYTQAYGWKIEKVSGKKIYYVEINREKDLLEHINNLSFNRRTSEENRERAEKLFKKDTYFRVPFDIQREMYENKLDYNEIKLLLLILVKNYNLNTTLIDNDFLTRFSELRIAHINKAKKSLEDKKLIFIKNDLIYHRLYKTEEIHTPILDIVQEYGEINDNVDDSYRLEELLSNI